MYNENSSLVFVLLTLEASDWQTGPPTVSFHGRYVQEIAKSMILYRLELHKDSLDEFQTLSSSTSIRQDLNLTLIKSQMVQ